MAAHKELDASISQLLQQGTVIPAHPLALTEDRQLDEERQRLLTQYYMASGAGGVAVGVHTTQFEIRSPGIDLYETVLQLAAVEIDSAQLKQPFIKVAGICGPTEQAVKEAELAIKYGYHIGLVSNGGIASYSETELIERTKAIATVIPVFGFYLQPAAGGRLLSYDFWRALANIPGVKAIKIAAFNRYQTIDVVRAVCDSDRRNEITLYTGNDDNIIADLLTTYRFEVNGEIVEKRFAGGLLGHWAFWTETAVALLSEIKQCIANNYSGAEKLLTKGIATTDINAVVFDAKNNFHGCIPGIHEILRRQGLLKGTWCLNKNEQLSAGQMEEIDRIYNAYPKFNDDQFVKNFLGEKEKVLEL